MESSMQIEERAAEWLARRDSDRWTESDEAEFNAWIEQSTLHVVAFVRLEAAWKQAKRLKALSAGVAPGAVPAPEEWQLAPFFDRGTTSLPDSSPESSVLSPERQLALRTRVALAASVLVAVAISTWYAWPPGSTYSTPVGGIAAVPMTDGSRVTLNTNSEIRVDVTDSERRVQLEHGEAYFEVAKDPNRPFVVNAGKTRVVALGTQFSVRREGNDVRVFVTEGKVRFEDASSPLYQSESTTPSPGREGQGPEQRDNEADFHSGKILLTAGSVARASDESVLVQEKAIPEIETYLSWRTGYLIFRDMPLADAIAEFNRYNARKIVIEDPTVAAIRISGKFRSTQFEAFVRLLEEGFPIHAQRADDRIILTVSRDTGA